MLLEILGNNYTFYDITILSLALLLLIGLIGTVFNIILGGLFFVFSGGNQDKVDRALGRIRYSVVGLVIMFGATVFIPLALNFFFEQGYQLDIIFKKALDVLKFLVDRLLINWPNSGYIYTKDFTNL